jgi:hypothetical protein
MEAQEDPISETTTTLSIPGVHPAFQPVHKRQTPWYEDPASTSRTLSSVLVASNHLRATSTWLATQVLRAVAEAAPEDIRVIMWSTGTRAARKLLHDVAYYSDRHLPATEISDFNGEVIVFGPQKSMVESRVFPRTGGYNRAGHYDLIVIDGLESVPAIEGSDPPEIDLRSLGVVDGRRSQRVLATTADQRILATTSQRSDAFPKHGNFVGVEHALRTIKFRHQ